MSNLPPGVSVGMIPGNRPEDEAWEKFLTAFDAECEKQKVEIPEECYDAHWFMCCLSIAASIAYNGGYGDALHDSELEQLEKGAM